MHTTDYFQSLSNFQDSLSCSRIIKWNPELTVNACDFRFTVLVLSKYFSARQRNIVLKKKPSTKQLLFVQMFFLNMVLTYPYMKTWINSYCSTTASSTKGFYTEWYCNVSHTMIKQRDLSTKQFSNILQYGFSHRKPRKRKVKVMVPMITTAWL